MNDALSFGEGDIGPDLNLLKQWTGAGAPFQQHQKHHPSVSELTDSDGSDSPTSSDGSSQGSSDSDLTAATSISPDSFDQFGPPFVADIAIDDDGNRHIRNPIPTAAFTSAEQEHSIKRGQTHEIGLQTETARPLTQDSEVAFVECVNTGMRESQDAQNSHEDQCVAWKYLPYQPHTSTRSDSHCPRQPCDLVSLRHVQYDRRSTKQLVDRSTNRPEAQSLLLPKSQQCLKDPSSVETETSYPGLPKVNPRRTKPQGSRPPPTLQRQDQRRHTYVDALVDITMKIVAKIWPSSCRPVQITADFAGREPQSKSNPVICLRYFIEEVLKRSRTSHSTLQVALFYCYKLGRTGRIPTNEGMRQSRHDPSARFLQCGRRMFLCSLILASKFIQDRNYSTRAWSKISSLPIAEINQCETSMLRALDYKIFIKAETFAKWARHTTLCVENSRLGMKCSFSYLDMVVDSDAAPTKPYTSKSTVEISLYAGDSTSTDSTSQWQGPEVAAIPFHQPARVVSPPGSHNGESFFSSTPPMPAAPQLSNASSPTSSPDSDSGHPATSAGSIIHWNTSHPTVGRSYHGIQNDIQTGLLTPAPTSPGSVSEENHTSSNTIESLQFSPGSRAADAQAWSELERRNQQTATEVVDLVTAAPSPETPVPPGLHLHEQESYLEEHSWIEDAEDDLIRQLEKKCGNRKQRPQPVSMQRKRSIGKCVGSSARHQSGRGEKISCSRK